MKADVAQTAYYIAFGAHGPRALPPPGEGWKVAAYTAIGVGVSFLLFVGIRTFARGSPSTMNKEWQEATNEYLKVCALKVMVLFYPAGDAEISSTRRGGIIGRGRDHLSSSWQQPLTGGTCASNFETDIR
jgi:hypothetical protein